MHRIEIGVYASIHVGESKQMDRVKVIKNEEFYTHAGGVLVLAEKTIDLCTYKFEFSQRTDARELNRLIERLYERVSAGIKIRALLHTTHARTGLTKINEHAAILLKAHGIMVRTLPDNRCQHAKMLLVDRSLAIIGSHNWSPKSLVENFEVSVVIADINLLENINKHFDEIWSKAIELK